MRQEMIVVGAALLAACGSDVGSISVEPASLNLQARGATATLRAMAKDKKGQPVRDPLKLVWTSSAPEVVTVNDAGRVVTRRSGDATITASFKEVKGAAAVHVAIPATIDLAPREVPPMVGAGSTFEMHPTVRDDAGRPMETSVLWASTAAGVVQVAGGRLTAVGAGTATVTALVPGGPKAWVKVTVILPEFARVTVAPPRGECKAGATLQLQGAAADAHGAPVQGVPVRWSSSDEKIARVSAAGLVTCVAAGKAQITAAAGDKTVVAPVVVR